MDEKEVYKTLPPDIQVLVDLIGFKLAIDLVLEIGGVEIYIPKVTNVLLKRLNDSGQSVDDLAQTTLLSRAEILKKIERVSPKNNSDGLNDITRLLVEIIGYDAVLKLYLGCGGSYLYVPMPSKKIIRYVWLKTNIHPIRLAAKCRVSSRTVYRAISGKY